MKKNPTIGIIIAIVVVIIVVILLVTSGGKGQNNPSNNSATSTVDQNTSQSSTNTQVLFKDSSLSQNAYLISTPTYDTSTKAALSGFNLTQKTLADGSDEVTITPTSPGTQAQVYTVTTGEKLYFIEGMIGDDTGNNDSNLGDDRVVLVDANGYIVNQ
jgi:cytoskeletal protein RodZ